MPCRKTWYFKKNYTIWFACGQCAKDFFNLKEI